jgi:hypothetical protein
VDDGERRGREARGGEGGGVESRERMARGEREVSGLPTSAEIAGRWRRCRRLGRREGVGQVGRERENGGEAEERE